MERSRYTIFSILFFALCLLFVGFFVLLKPDPVQQDIRELKKPTPAQNGAAD